jgi:hypothetical protein
MFNFIGTKLDMFSLMLITPDLLLLVKRSEPDPVFFIEISFCHLQEVSMSVEFPEMLRFFWVDNVIV